MWGPGAQGGFQNALAMGLQFGQMARQEKDRRDERNALAAYAQNPNEQTLGGLAPFRPDVVLGERERMAQQRQAAQDQRNKQLGTFRQLLTAAGSDPQRAFAAAQGMGMDLSGIPQPGTPEFEPWRQEQLFIVEALADPAKADQVDRDLARLGYTPGTPGYEQAARELILFSRAKQGTDEYGRPVFDLPNIAPPPGQSQGGSGGVTPNYFYGVFDVQGPEGAVAWSQQNPVRVTTPQEAASLPRGTRIILPDGSEGRVP